MDYQTAFVELEIDQFLGTHAAAKEAKKAALNGAEIGDAFTMDNRCFLAWKYYYRHMVLCDRAEYPLKFC